MELSLDFNFTPRKWQAKCMAEQTRFTVLAVHRRAGKTNLAVFELIQAAFSKVGLYAYIAPELKQARIIAWDLIKQMLSQFHNLSDQNGLPLVEVHETEPYIKLYNGSKIMLFGADKPDRLRGAKLTGAVIDEVAQMPRILWSEIVYPALMDSHGWALFIGTPKGINLFSELFNRGFDTKFKPDWSSARFTCYETDALSPEDIEMYKRDVSDDEFKREMLCDFSAATADQLIRLSDIEMACRREILEEMIIDNSLIMGVDVARYGNDNSCITFRQGLRAEAPIRYKGLNLVDLAGYVAKLYRLRHPKAVYIDGTGVGGGVVDILAKYNIPAFDINFGQKATEKQYVNKRTEMWCKLADWLKKGGALPNDELLKTELAAPLYEKDDKGQITLESKKKIKERIGYSPDCADSLALTFAGYVDEVDIKDNSDLYRELIPQKQKNKTPYQRFKQQVAGRGYISPEEMAYRRAYYGSYLRAVRR